MKFKKLLTTLLATVLALALPMSASAATWEGVDNYEKLSTAFGDTDSEVTIILSGNVVNENGEVLTANDGQIYTINGGEYTLSDVVLNGSGDVIINADIVGTDAKDALDTKEEVNITVNGNIDAINDAVDANDQSVVVVNGTVSSKELDGLDVDGEAQVTVNGDVYGGSGADGVDASDDSKVIVNGNVYGGDGIAPDEDGNLNVGTMSDPEGYSDGGAGVEADKNAQVIVNGDVYGGDSYGTYGYAGAGIKASDNAKVEVSGSAYGGDQIADPNVTPNTVMDSTGEYTTNGYAGDGVYMDNTADVTIGGDAVGGDASGQDAVAGSGVYIDVTYTADVYRDSETGETVADPIIPGQVTVEGTAVGGDSIHESGHDGCGVYFAVYEDNPVEDSILSDERIDTICSNDNLNYLKSIVTRAMPSVINNAGMYYIDNDICLEYKEQYTQMIKELAKEYGVEINEEYTLEDIVDCFSEDVLANFVEEAIKIGNEIIAEMAKKAYAVPMVNANDLKTTGDAKLVGAPTEELEEYFEENYVIIKGVNNNSGSSAGSAATDSPATGDDMKVSFMGLITVIFALTILVVSTLILRRKER